MAKVLAVPDIHLPWGDKHQLDEIISAAKAEQPDVILQAGDAFDFYCFSRFARSMDLITPAEELRLGREHFETLWAALRWAAPNASCVQLLGNHDLRIRNEVSKKFPEMNAVLDALDFESLWRFSGVELHTPARNFRWIDGVGYHHGDWLRSMSPGARAKDAMASVVFGHTHRAWLLWIPHWGGKQIFEFSVGNVAFSDSLPLQYTPSNVPSTTNGFGVIDNAVPRFIPL